MRHSPVHPSVRRRLQRGVSLIEVLVTVIVLAIGLLGLAGLQLNSLRFTYSAYQSSQATVMTYDILDRMRANAGAAQTGAYDIAIGTEPGESSCTGGGANCSSGDMAGADIFEWKEALAAVLPAGDGSIARNGDLFIITIQWDDSRGEQDPKSLTVETTL